MQLEKIIPHSGTIGLKTLAIRVKRGAVVKGLYNKEEYIIMKSQKVYYYLAYGSNTNLRQMQMRCPNSELIATGFLKGYELLFRGHDGNCFCTIEKAATSRVPVAIFKITERCKMA